MGRKKNYKDGELENEFNEFMYQHMYITIRSTLLAFQDENIIDSDLVHYTIGIFEGTYEEKLEALCAEIVNLHDTGRDKEITPLYEYCWKILSPKLADNERYEV